MVTNFTAIDCFKAGCLSGTVNIAEHDGRNNSQPETFLSGRETVLAQRINAEPVSVP